MRNFFLIVLLCILAVNADAQIAMFETKNMSDNIITDTFFCESVQLKFNNTSNPGGNEPSAYTFRWFFGKPLKTTVKDTVLSINTFNEVRMRFDRPGWHAIRLVMYSVETGDTVSSFTDSIEIRPRPNAWFSVADTFQLGDLTYRFLSGKAPSSNINYTYKWVYNRDTVTQKNQTNKQRNLYIKKFNSETADEGMNPSTEIMTLIVSDDKNCKDSYSGEFRVRKKLFLPSGFSPNDDGVNDFFTVQVNGRDIYNFQVFNPKGMLVFESEAKSIVWDGYDFNGRKAPAGMYYFILETVNGAVPAKETGFVMLLRGK